MTPGRPPMSELCDALLGEGPSGRHLGRPSCPSTGPHYAFRGARTDVMANPELVFIFKTIVSTRQVGTDRTVSEVAVEPNCDWAHCERRRHHLGQGTVGGGP